MACDLEWEVVGVAAVIPEEKQFYFIVFYFVEK